MGGTPYQFTDGDLDSALRRRQFEICLQPQFALTTGAITACEAMVRWRHPVLGVLPPGVFLSYVQTRRRMGDLTRAVMEQAMSAAAVWREAGKDWELSFNICASDLLDRDFSMTGRVLADKHRIEPHWVTIEIAEAELIAAGPRAREGLERLREAGFRTALDAKGVAPPQEHSLIASGLFTQFKMGGPPLLRIAAATAMDGGGVAGTRVREAHALDLVCVAVGVESPIISSALLALGFDRGQGAAYQRPMELADLMKAYDAVDPGAELAVLRGRGAPERRRWTSRGFGRARSAAS